MAVSRAHDARVLLAHLGKRFAPTPWSLVRALAALGFVVFAGTTSIRWLRTAIEKPLHSERVSLPDTYSPSAFDHDVAMLRRWLPVEGKIGYWSDLPQFRLHNVRLHLAPLLLDPDWRKYDLVLVDYVVGPHRAEIESPSYELIANMVDAQSFASNIQLFRRKPR